MRIAALFAILPAALTVCAPAQPADWCVPAPAVKAALDQLPATLPQETEWQYDQRQKAAIQSLVTQFPDDLFVARTRILYSYRRAEKDKVIADYKARYEHSPDDPVAAYLYAEALVGRDSPKSIEILQATLKKSPQFPWPHLGLATIYAMPVFQNKDEKVAHLKAFLAACPASLDGYRPVATLDDKQFLSQQAAKLRAVLAARSDMDAIRAYATLWSIEFKAHPMSEYDAVRKQVNDDLKRIRALNWTDKRGWLYTLEQGYKLVNDEKQAEWASGERMSRWDPWEPVAALKWFKAHERPGDDAAADKKRAYYADLLKQTDQWLKESPESADLWGSRLDAMDHLADVPSADVETVAGRYLKLVTDQAGPDGPGSYEYFRIARVLSRKHLQPEHVLDLATKGLAQVKVEISESSSGFDGWNTKENLQSSHFYDSLNPLTGSELEADSYVQLKQADKAHLTLVRMEDELQATQALVVDKPEFKKEYTNRMGKWWGLMARTAELQGHRQDAMAYYEHALIARLEAQQMPETGMPDEVANDARHLWTSLGGTNDGWQIWYGAPADKLANRVTLTWEDANQPLPAFELVDLKGKTWTQASLKGKVTFLNFWASW